MVAKKPAAQDADKAAGHRGAGPLRDAAEEALNKKLDEFRAKFAKRDPSYKKSRSFSAREKFQRCGKVYRNNANVSGVLHRHGTSFAN